jgi:APA family basic amino acid/polyamine antiporter
VLPIETLGELAAAGTLLAFAIVCTGILVLRQRSPELPRPFRTPFSPLVPLIGILSCVGLLFTLPLAAWIRLLVWMAIGLMVYWMYSRHHSVAGGAISDVM